MKFKIKAVTYGYGNYYQVFKKTWFGWHSVSTLFSEIENAERTVQHLLSPEKHYEA